MSVTPNDHLFAPDLVAAARKFIRSKGDRCVIGIRELLNELSDKFGDRFSVSPDTHEVLDLIETLWADPQIDQVPDTGWIDFAWSEEGVVDQVPVTGLKAVLLGRFQIPSATKEET